MLAQDDHVVAVFGHLNHRLQYLSLDTINRDTTCPIANHTSHGQALLVDRDLSLYRLSSLSISLTYPRLPSICLTQSPSEQAPSAKAGLRAWLIDKQYVPQQYRLPGNLA